VNGRGSSIDVPFGMKIEWMGMLIYELMGLDRLPAEHVNEVAALLR
jgi:hypothetical protein